MNHRQHRALSAQKRQAINLVRNPVWRCLSKTPLDQGKQTSVQLAGVSAFDEIIHGNGTLHHVDDLAMVCNVSTMLCEAGYQAESELKVRMAHDALVRMTQRHVQQSKSLGFDGPGAQAVRDLLQIHDTQTLTAGTVAVADAILAVHARIDAGHVDRISTPIHSTTN